MRKIGSKQYEEQFFQLMILILSNIGDYRYTIIMIIVKNNILKLEDFRRDTLEDRSF
jgi:hypothetical protein